MKTAFAALAILASVPAFATSTYHTLVRCQPTLQRFDAGVELLVQSYTGPGTIGRPSPISATLTHFFLGRSFSQSFYGLTIRRPAAGVMGGSSSVVGNDFNLEMYTDSAPLPNGMIRSQLTYTEKNSGVRQSEEMGCQILR